MPTSSSTSPSRATRLTAIGKGMVKAKESGFARPKNVQDKSLEFLPVFGVYTRFIFGL
jgi:hypothetical protein